MSSWHGADAASFGRAADRALGELSPGREATAVVATELRNVASYIDSVQGEHDSLRRRLGEVRSSLTPGDLLEVANAETRMRDIERSVVSRMNSAAVHIEAAARRAKVGVAANPDLRHQVGSALSGAWHAVKHGAKDVAGFGFDFGKGVFVGGRDFIEFAWSTSTVRMFVDPIGYAKTIKSYVEGIGQLGHDLVTDPGDTLYRVFQIDTLEHHPGEWLGEIALAVVGSKGIGMVAKSAETAVVVETDEAVIGSERASGLSRAVQLSPEEASAISAQYDWGIPSTLQRHFREHKDDFGLQTPEDYAKSAHDFLIDAPDLGVQAKVDDDGVLRVYDASTNTFATYNKTGTTKTFFKPGRGQAYFDDETVNPGRPIDIQTWRPTRD